MIRTTTAARFCFPVLVLLFFSSVPARSDLKSEDHAPQNLAPAAALKELKDGNARYVSGKAGHCGTDAGARAGLVESQAPDAVILSCSDSRVPPESVFDQGLGKIFAVRVAGNVLNDETVASIEYAISHLGTRLIVVMGHESCGAVKAALTTPKGQNAGSPSLDVLVAEVRKNLGGGDFSAGIQDSTLRTPVKRNVSAVAAELLKRSPIVKNAVDSGKAKVVQAIYGLATGKVEFWGP